MATLLEAESLEYKSLRRGEILEGVVVDADRDGMVVDVGTKSEGIIPPSEMHSLGPNAESWPNPGDHILVYVMQPETPEGQVLLSLDRARGERGWRVLQQRFEDGESFQVQVSGFNKGGLLVNVEGVHAFIPFSQSVSAQPPPEEEGKESESPPEAVVGKTLLVKVIEINRARNRVILSERAAMQDWRALQKDRLLEELAEGEIRKGRVSSIRSFGVFVDIGGADGLAHLSELSWERDKSPEELYHIGQEVDVYVMKVDREAKKIALSIRRAQPEQWEQIVDKYTVGQIVTGTITKLVTFGAFARIEGPVEGLVHVSELVNRRIAHPREVVKEGDVVPLKIVRIERDRQRLGLSLRAAHDEAEEMGFVFGKDGQVVGLPGGEPQKGAPTEAEGATPEVEAEEAPARPVAKETAVQKTMSKAVEAKAERAPAEPEVEQTAVQRAMAEAIEAKAEAEAAAEAAAEEMVAPPVAEAEEEGTAEEPAVAALAEAGKAEPATKRKAPAKSASKKSTSKAAAKAEEAEVSAEELVAPPVAEAEETEAAAGEEAPAAEEAEVKDEAEASESGADASATTGDEAIKEDA
jgi:small subunit ribosomal protein S1